MFLAVSQRSQRSVPCKNCPIPNPSSNRAVLPLQALAQSLQSWLSWHGPKNPKPSQAITCLWPIFGHGRLELPVLLHPTFGTLSSGLRAQLILAGLGFAAYKFYIRPRQEVALGTDD